MILIENAPGRADIRRWAGLADPGPGQARLAAAAIAALLTIGLTAFGSTLEELGPGFGRLFIVFAIVVGPAVSGLLILRPWTGLVAWAAMMPLLNVARLQVWFGPLQVTQSTIFVGALAIGVVLDRASRSDATIGLAEARPDLGRPSWPRGATLVAIGLIGFSVLSLLASPAVATGIPIVLHGVVEPVLVVLLVILARPTPRRSAALGGALVLGLALASVYSILRIGRVATTLDQLEAMRVQLAHFTFYNVGIYGDALAMTIPLAIAWLLSSRALGLRRTGSVVLLALLAILFVGLYLTFSKSAWLGAWLAIGAVLLARFRARRQIAAIVVCAAVFLALIVPYPVWVLSALGIDTGPYVQLVSGVQGSRLSSWDVGSPEGEVSIGERWRATQAAVRMTVDHPLLGVGPGRFGDEYAGPYADPAATRHLGSPHDFIPEVASELGIPAAVLVLVGILAALWSAWRAVRARDQLLRAVGGAFGAALIAFLAVTATFGLDLYRDYRVMNSDVIMAGLIVGVCLSLGPYLRRTLESPGPVGPAAVG